MQSMKADLHVHSKYSTRPSYWILQKLGCSESYVEPKTVYDIAKRKGMRFITITDHNTIAGSLEIAHLPGAFVSEEITTYFPENGCKVHVLAYHITESQHEDISRVRGSIYDLAAYLNRQAITHVVAHPLFAVNDRCNARCPHCGMRVSNSFQRTRLPMDIIRRILGAAGENQAAAVSFTGGEPLLLPDDLVGMILHAGEAGIPLIRTGTNGFFMRPGPGGRDRDIARITAVVAL